MRNWTNLVLILALSFSCKNSEVLFGQGRIISSSDDPISLDITIERNLIIVPVEIDGKSYRFLFDSGAPLVVSKELSESLGMKVLKRSNVRDSQGKINKQNYVRIESLSMGGEEFQGFTAIEADLRFSPLLRCMNFDGVLGANLMQYRYWEINSADSTLIMSKSKAHWNWQGKTTYRIPFTTKTTRTPVLRLPINGLKVSGITFDTGSSGVLSLPKKVKEGLDPDSLVFDQAGYLSGGLFGSTLDSSEEHMLSFDFPDTNFYFPVEFESTKRAGLLGMNFLKHFRVFIDWPAKEIGLQSPRPFVANAIWPLGPYFDQGIIVGSRNSLIAEQNIAGIELGDTIIACNGVDYSNADRDDFCRILEQFSQEQEQLKIEIKGKGVFEIYRRRPY